MDENHSGPVPKAGDKRCIHVNSLDGGDAYWATKGPAKLLTPAGTTYMTAAKGDELTFSVSTPNTFTIFVEHIEGGVDGQKHIKFFLPFNSNPRTLSFNIRLNTREMLAAREMIAARANPVPKRKTPQGKIAVQKSKK